MRESLKHVKEGDDEKKHKWTWPMVRRYARARGYVLRSDY